MRKPNLLSSVGDDSQRFARGTGKGMHLAPSSRIGKGLRLTSRHAGAAGFVRPMIQAGIRPKMKTTATMRKLSRKPIV